MSWKKYEEFIVNQYHVAIIGWPEEITFDPQNLGYRQLKTLLDGLSGEEPTIYWKKLTNAEYEERRRCIKVIPRARKPRSDKGVRRMTTGNKRKRTGKGGEEWSDDASPSHSPKSSEVVENSDSDSSE